MPHFGPDAHPGAADFRQQAQHCSNTGRIVVDIGAPRLAHHVIAEIAQVLRYRAAASRVETAAQLGDAADAAVQQLRLAHDVAAVHAAARVHAR
jgi:hypothetical protein